MEYEYREKFEEGDRRLRDIENVIESKRKFLLEKQKKFKTVSKTNNFLKEIESDYQRYYDYIVKQKHDQIKALEILNKYIYDLAENGELTKQNINDSKYEQKRILNEISTIKSNLNSLIQEKENYE